MYKSLLRYFGCCILAICVPSSSVGIATDYGLDDPGIESRRGEIFCLSRPAPGAHPAFYTMDTGSFPGVKYGRGVLLTTHPLLVSRSWKSRAIPLPTLWATTGPVTGTLYFFLYVSYWIRVSKASVPSLAVWVIGVYLWEINLLAPELFFFLILAHLYIKCE